jgi:hypothetical protein
MRQIGYRAAVTAFVFTGLWFIFGILLLWSPLPGVLGIRGQLFPVWLLLFLAMLAGSGATLVVASFNGVFPRNIQPPRRSASLWATPPADAATPSRRTATPSGASRPSHRG